MIIPTTHLNLADTTQVMLKSPSPEDALMLIQHKKITSSETHFMMRYEEEVGSDLADEVSFINAINDSPDEFMLAAYSNGTLVGNAGIQHMKKHIKTMHRGYFGISIQAAYCNAGLGSQLLVKCMEHVKNLGYTQIELGVFSDNPRAFHVYEKYGFQCTGTVPRAYRLKDGSYLDEHQMVYYLD